MAKYTTELRSICETYAGYEEGQGYSNVKDVIEKALPKLFDFDFPIYDEAYRTVLETKIVRHFYTREICAETVGRWKLFLEDRLNLIMPYYNKLYQSELVEFNPMYDVDLTTDHTKDNGGNAESQSNRTDSGESNRKYARSDDYTRNLADSSDSSGTSTTHATDVDSQTSRQRYNDTPQGGLTGIENNQYLTNVTMTDADDSDTSDSNTTTTDKNTGTQTGTTNRTLSDTDDTTTSSTGNQNGTSKYTDTESYLEHVKGKTAGTSYSRLLQEYRATFLNIDRQIIDNLNDLFINLW